MQNKKLQNILNILIIYCWKLGYKILQKYLSNKLNIKIKIKFQLIKYGY